MQQNDSTLDITPTPWMSREIEAGEGEWAAVPQCVRETLLALLAPPATRGVPSHAIEPSARTLLPLRLNGPKTDVVAALNAAYQAHRPPALFVPNLQSVVSDLDERLSRCPQHGSAGTTTNTAAAAAPRGTQMEEKEVGSHTVEEPLRLPDKRVYYGVVADAPSELSRKPCRLSSRRSGSTSAQSPLRKVRPIALDAPTVKRVECVRHRRDTTAALLRVHDKIARLQAAADGSLVKSVYDAMRLDPRRARDVYGDVKPLPHPTQEQEQALAAFAEGLAVLQEATQELVAAFLSQEEKRFLGVNTHKFQTRSERANTYQYTSDLTRPKNRDSVKQSRLVPAPPAAAAPPPPTSPPPVASADVAPPKCKVNRSSSNRKKNRSKKNGESDRRVSAPAAVPPDPSAVISDDNNNNEAERAVGVDVADAPNVQSTANKRLPHTQGRLGNSLLGPSVDPLRGRKEGSALKKQVPQAVGRGGGAAKVAAPPAPAATLQRQISRSTLSMDSSESSDGHVGGKRVTDAAAKKPAVVTPTAATTAPQAAAPSTLAEGLRRLDFKRFLIVSDSDSEDVA